MPITFESKGDFSKLTRWLERADENASNQTLEKYAKAGVAALAEATPKDTGLTASSWDYEIIRTNTQIKINFLNTNIQNGIPIAIILQYGHATKNGGWVEGIDYVNPAIRPIFNDLADAAWKEVID